jgi:uncharacterized protein (DUF1778 family)
MTIAISEQAKLDTRLPKQQKEFFKKASVLGGYRNLSDFIIQAAQEKAKEIIMEREQIIASERDSEVFFKAIMNPLKPNNSLRKAAGQYKSHFPE